MDIGQPARLFVEGSGPLPWGCHPPEMCAQCTVPGTGDPL